MKFYQSLKKSIRNSDLSKVVELIKTGSAIDILDDAISEGDTELVSALISCGLDVNQELEDGDTFLIRASAYDSLRVVELLINAGADITVKNCDGDTALLTAAKNGQEKIFRYLSKMYSTHIVLTATSHLEKGIQYRRKKEDLLIERFIDAASKGDVNLLQQSLLQSVDINSVSADGNTALYAAASFGHVNVISALISVKTDLDSRNEDSSWTALMSAARSGHYEVVGLLVEAGADLTLQDSRGLTALDLARRFGYTKIVNFLSKLGCEITPKNDDNTNLTPAQDANLEK